MAIYLERALPLWSYFSAVLIVGSPSHLVFKSGCGIWLYRFLIIVFSSTCCDLIIWKALNLTDLHVNHELFCTTLRLPYLLGDSKTNVTVSPASLVFIVMMSSFPAHLIIFAILKENNEPSPERLWYISSAVNSYFKHMRSHPVGLDVVVFCRTLRQLP